MNEISKMSVAREAIEKSEELESLLLKNNPDSWTLDMHRDGFDFRRALKEALDAIRFAKIGLGDGTKFYNEMVEREKTIEDILRKVVERP